MGLKIDILCNDGSPLGVTEKSIFGEDGRMGVGGAELALLTMCRAWQYYGNDVTLYNNPNNPLASTFKQRNISDFHAKDERDVLIIFRSPMNGQNFIMQKVGRCGGVVTSSLQAISKLSHSK